jgi:pyrroloquinoline quinone biosynthesis protein D
LNISQDSVPVLRRGVRRQFDAARHSAVLLAPERVVLLDEIGDAIIEECGAGGNVREISKRLALRFQAPPDEVEADVIGFLQQLFDKGLLTP